MPITGRMLDGNGGCKAVESVLIGVHIFMTLYIMSFMVDYFLTYPKKILLIKKYYAVEIIITKYLRVCKI
jgi:hypothetical protein